MLPWILICSNFRTKFPSPYVIFFCRIVSRGCNLEVRAFAGLLPSNTNMHGFPHLRNKVLGFEHSHISSRYNFFPMHSSSSDLIHAFPFMKSSVFLSVHPMATLKASFPSCFLGRSLAGSSFIQSSEPPSLPEIEAIQSLSFESTLSGRCTFPTSTKPRKKSDGG